MNRFCSNCGSELQDNAQFCTACGTPVGGPSAPQQPTPPPAAPPTQAWQPTPPPPQPWQPAPQAWPQPAGQGGGNGGRIALIAGLGITVITVAIVLLVVLLGGGGPTSVVKDLNKAYIANDCEKIGKLSYFAPQDGSSTAERRASSIDDCNTRKNDSSDSSSDYTQIAFKATQGKKMTASDFDNNEFPDGVTQAREVKVHSEYKYKNSDGETTQGCYDSSTAVVKVNGDWLADNDYSFPDGDGAFNDCSPSSGDSSSSSKSPSPDDSSSSDSSGY